MLGVESYEPEQQSEKCEPSALKTETPLIGD